MASSSGYASEILSLDREITRLDAHVKALKAQRRLAMDRLHAYMVKHKLEAVTVGESSITIKRCAPPKPRAKPKPKTKKRAEAIELFRDAGIPNPEDFYNDFEQTQRVKAAEVAKTDDFDF